ncbi:hypothetical protein B0T22DRAFT_522504 [Podospora appendiculata]|uniref:Uncharacterized protein n=1 Tax=Podospora appendiculata TaxID=314037 RepID=A0AAE1C8M0_9PEZI|nr:hypothetical protein B0T22DRAFT_522504 [Podospora appendiculata]
MKNMNDDSERKLSTPTSRRSYERLSSFIIEPEEAALFNGQVEAVLNGEQPGMPHISARYAFTVPNFYSNSTPSQIYPTPSGLTPQPDGTLFRRVGHHHLYAQETGPHTVPLPPSGLGEPARIKLRSQTPAPATEQQGTLQPINPRNLFASSQPAQPTTSSLFPNAPNILTAAQQQEWDAYRERRRMLNRQRLELYREAQATDDRTHKASFATHAEDRTPSPPSERGGFPRTFKGKVIHPVRPWAGRGKSTSLATVPSPVPVPQPASRNPTDPENYKLIWPDDETLSPETPPAPTFSSTWAKLMNRHYGTSYLDSSSAAEYLKSLGSDEVEEDSLPVAATPARPPPEIGRTATGYKPPPPAQVASRFGTPIPRTPMERFLVGRGRGRGRG